MENNDWINDVALEQDLRDCVRRRNLKRKEILRFMKRDYEQYCTATLNRRLHFFISTIYIMRPRWKRSKLLHKRN